MVKPTDKNLSALKAQERNLEQAILKYNHSPKLVRAEQITEQQIRAKGGKPHANPKEKAKQGAIQRRMKKN